LLPERCCTRTLLEQNLLHATNSLLVTLASASIAALSCLERAIFDEHLPFSDAAPLTTSLVMDRFSPIGQKNPKNRLRPALKRALSAHE
jgi:hypothetical protein